MHYVILPIVGLLAAGIHIVLAKTRNPKYVVETVLAYALFFNMGLSGLYAFMGHAFAPDKVAAYIGWPAGSPFQFEIAVTNLALGTLGILCFWIRGKFWLAAIIACSIFGFGAGYGHIMDAVVRHNYAPGNAGAPLYWDMIKPALLILLYILHARLSSSSGMRVQDGEAS